MTYSIVTIATLIGAHRIGTADSRINWLLTDSRSLVFPEDSLFFAIRTAKNDGHRYIPELYGRGVRNFVVSQLPEHPEADANYLQVPSPLKALQRLAERHREELNIPVIGITGSNGKTIVKEWLYQLLAPDFNITRSPRSWNSQIGVPLSVWRLSEQTQLGIFEAGISESGEMDALQGIIQPTIGVLTHLGSAHDENFADRREKCMEKLRLFRDAEVLIYHADDELVSDCIARSGFKGQLIGWRTLPPASPSEGGEYILSVTDSVQGTTVTTPLPYKEGLGGESLAGIENVCTCICVCRYLGLPDAVIRERIQRLEPVAMRLEVKEGRNGCTLITDTCNSDLGSLEIALDFMRRRPEAAGRRRVLILSDIKQTGLTLTDLYRQVADLIRQYGVDEFIGIGPEVSAGMANVDNGPSTLPTHTFSGIDTFLASSLVGDLKDCIVLIKGARQARFDRIADALVQKVHETILEVNLSAVVDNLNYYRAFMRPETKMVCMVKASAYGAGAVEIARTLQDHRVDYLAVAVADEGVELRRAGITANIMVMNPEMSSFRTLFEYGLEPEVYSFRLLDALSHAAEREGITNFPIHVKLDTGMHRLGFEPQKDLDELIRRLQAQKALIVRSVFSHFVGSDSDDFDAFSEHQWTLFSEAADRLQAAFPHRILRHICNSAGIEHFPERHCDMVRLGLGLYGINARNNEMLSCISTLKTTILQIHDVPATDTVGYSRKGHLSRDSRIAALPIGYADGLDRHLGCGNGYCLVNGQKAPYVGNICMDVCMIDVTDIDCREGDTAVIFGPDLPPSVLSDAIGTIPYEILTSVSPRVKRIYYVD
ncbi:MAG: bifunctional UDP-N-acetylmuramoyl-tripeptide:D-alanyl-D-alanine ligase/alanine racemase [Bacteroidaceae bacterium]|nr:bifunctional UDP-N-acetylmuramoyl-tripeptide:D-alanyl-D-alanine ligase/alanine racemase [Bacteroidaceae bacterium]